MKTKAMLNGSWLAEQTVGAHTRAANYRTELIFISIYMAMRESMSTINLTPMKEKMGLDNLLSCPLVQRLLANSFVNS